MSSWSISVGRLFSGLSVTYARFAPAYCEYLSFGLFVTHTVFAHTFLGYQSLHHPRLVGGYPVVPGFCSLPLFARRSPVFPVFILVHFSRDGPHYYIVGFCTFVACIRLCVALSFRIVLVRDGVVSVYVSPFEVCILLPGRCLYYFLHRGEVFIQDTVELW